MIVETIEQLRELYPPAMPRAIGKQLSALDGHCRRFIGLSPFVVLSTAGADGALDASPRGGEPGFVRVVDAGRLLVTDASGNNRLDSLQNIVQTGRIGMLFLIPGVDETLRVNGHARLCAAPELLASFAGETRPPKLAIDVTITDAYLHCAKALMRSKLWEPASLVDRSVLPTMGQMLKDQIGFTEAAESQESMLARYREAL
jgi:PPOX class probable FMN-dependent enzyme